MTRAIHASLLWTVTFTIACGKDSGTTGDATAVGDTTTAGATTTVGDTTVAEPTTTTAAQPTGTGDIGTTAAAGTTDGTCMTGFICTPDAGGDQAFECDVFKQDCGEDEKCVAWGMGGSSGWNATKCVQIMGDGVPGDTCSAPEGGLSGHDDCGAGAFCWDVLNNQGVCVALCTGTPDAPMCDAESTCLVSNGGSLNLCLPSCDPLIQDCPGDDLCVPSGNGFLCSQDASGDGGQTNDPCQGGNVCDKGLLCLDTATASSACNPNSTGCCQPYCEYPDSPCPNPDQKCVQWFDPEQLPPDDPLLAVGVCGIPQ